MIQTGDCIMLYEIVCDKFISNAQQRGKIYFYDGLNVIQGHNSGTNSIGKSTFLLVVDFAFGGNTYAKNKKIIKKIGHHTINFCFRFDDEFYYFSRNTKTSDYVNICDVEYSVVKTVKLNDFCNQLLQLYKIDLPDLSFRKIVSCFFRIYGKNNSNELLPLEAYAQEPQEESLTTLLKLYNVYAPIAQLHNDIEEKRKYKKAMNDASKYSIVKIITASSYKENNSKIEKLKSELASIVKYGRQEILAVDPQQATIAAEYKARYDSFNRQRKQLWTKYYALKDNALGKGAATTQDFNELLKFFPNSNLKLLRDIEGFHAKISSILTDEFHAAISSVLQSINAISKEMSELETQMEKLDLPQRISENTLKKYAEIKNEIDRLQKENEIFLEQKRMSDEINNLKKNYEKLFFEKAGDVSQLINEEMANLNSYIYGNDTVPPELKIQKSNSYTFGTPVDGGTGTNNKNLILLDLATLRFTPLPTIAHDTIIFKHIAQAPMEKILELYNKSKKQIFIAIDETLKYPKNAQDIIESNTVLKLSADGNELFGSSWMKRNSTRQN